MSTANFTPVSPSPSTRATVAKQCRRIAELRGWAYAAGVDGNLRKCNQLDDVADERDAVVEAIEDQFVPALASGVVTLQALGHLDTCRCASLARQRVRDDRRDAATRAPRAQVELRVSGGACDVHVVGASSVATASAPAHTAPTSSTTPQQRLRQVIKPRATVRPAPAAAPAPAPAAAPIAPAPAPTLPAKSRLLVAAESLYQPDVVEAAKVIEQSTVPSTFRYPKLVVVAQALHEAGRTGRDLAHDLRKIHDEVLLGLPTLSDCLSYLQAALDVLSPARPGAIVESMQEVAEAVLIAARCAAGDTRGQDRYRLLLESAINKLSFCAFPGGRVHADAELAIAAMRLLRDDVRLASYIARLGGAWSTARVAA